MSRAVSFSHSPSGWRQFEQSADIGNAMESIARDIAAVANSEGESDYSSRGVVDVGGQSNTMRAAAEVYTDDSTSGDARERKLISVSYAYRVRGIG